MSVLIKGMTLPQNCFYCEIMHKTEDGEWMKCPLAGFKYRMHDMYTYVSGLTQPHPDCPLVALPEKHGRLIDADKLIIDLMDRGLEGIQTNDYSEIQQTIIVQDTVIEQEGE